MFPEVYKFSSALYTFDIGQNDLIAGYDLGMSTEQVKAYVPEVISRFTTVIKNVYALGGRAFWIHNTGPAGCLPYILDTQAITSAQKDEYGCATLFNDVSQYFKEKLKEAIVQLRKDLHLAAICCRSTEFGFIGFGDPFLVCCGHGGKHNFDNAFWCGMMKTVNGTKIISKSCEDPSSRIIWDGIHFTEAANRWVYSQIADGAYSDQPVPLNMACHREHDLRGLYL
ncbi:hypothetical protein L1987_62067 [Smallanthus sonchifolius]|uniref:Uncharacterized protein n=1 Tax=Smallanthus sonchifolius TaxID=185202 RepID=A0ACB9C9N7_9ASTR|nr:hypothetical protein L1987_62067 [Smallanthus sonchifolius]